MPEEEAHLCPVRAMAEWINASHITTGYLFRRMASGDRPAEKNVPLVSWGPFILGWIRWPGYCHMDRLPSSSLKCFATTCSILPLTHHHMARILSVEAAVNILRPTGAGHFEPSVNGVDGARSSQIWRSSNIWFLGMMIQLNKGKTSLIPTVLLLWNVLFVGDHATVRRHSSRHL